MSNIRPILLIILTTALLQACGGSGSDSVSLPTQPSTAPQPVPQTDTVSLSENGLYLHGALTASVGESVGFALTTDDQIEITTINWQQMSGPSVDILASHTQAIGFDVKQPGDYQFTVNALLSTNETRMLTFALSVVESGQVESNIRLDHAATELGRVSLRVDTAINKEVSRIQWLQVAGPAAANVRTQSDFGEEFNAQKPHSLFFDAPSVSRDQVIQYRATVTYTDDSQSTDDALVLIDNININNNGYFTNSDLYVSSHMIPYRSNSPHAGALQRCIYNNQLDDSCSFSELPLLGMQTTTPSIEDVLNRTLVSHPWMGERFEEYLRQSIAGQDMLNLLRGTTAVVISYDIRPAFYWAVTGAIYLDANYFWRTPEERDTLNTAPDFRSNFGNDLQFGIFWRYVKNGQSYLSQAFPAPNERGTKDFDALEASITWLMYHELGHANDFFAPRNWASIDTNLSPLEYVNNFTPDSTPMSALYPLTSSNLKSLAQVSFGGETANETQRNYSPLDIEGFYVPDIAPAYYAYFTEREDYATLFERFMMLYRYGIPADTGIIGRVNNPNATVTWGVRARINSPALRSRLRYAVERIYPELNFDQIQPQLQQTQLLPANTGWFDILTLDENSELPMGPMDNESVYDFEELGHRGLPHIDKRNYKHDPRTLPSREHNH